MKEVEVYALNTVESESAKGSWIVSQGIRDESSVTVSWHWKQMKAVEMLAEE